MRKQANRTIFSPAGGLMLALLVATLICGGCTKNIPLLHDKKEARAVLPFSDIPAPLDMIVDSTQTQIMEADTLRAGTVVLSGYVKEESLVEFYRKEMPRYGWHLQNVYIGDHTTMLFYKSGRSAIINIRENIIKTVVEIKSAPDR